MADNISIVYTNNNDYYIKKDNNTKMFHKINSDGKINDEGIDGNDNELDYSVTDYRYDKNTALFTNTKPDGSETIQFLDNIITKTASLPEQLTAKITSNLPLNNPENTPPPNNPEIFGKVIIKATYKNNKWELDKIGPSQFTDIGNKPIKMDDIPKALDLNIFEAPYGFFEDLFVTPGITLDESLKNKLKDKNMSKIPVLNERKEYVNSFYNAIKNRQILNIVGGKRKSRKMQKKKKRNGNNKSRR